MRRYTPSYLLPAVLTVALAGCGGNTDEGSNPAATGSSSSKVSGTVVIDGSSTVFRISKAAQIAYTKERGSDVKVLVNSSGTGGGFGKYLENEIDIVDASRPAKPEEESKALEKKLDWTKFLIGYDGITVVVNPKNEFVKSLTVAQLKSLFEPESKITTWKQLDPSWPDRKIILYTPDNDSGTYEFFAEAIVGGKTHRKDVQASPNDNELIRGVTGDEDALGYFGYAYYAANKATLRAVPIQNGPDATPIAASPETILDATYKPLARPLFLYVKNRAFQENPGVADFLKYYLENADTLVNKAGYVPPKPEDKDANQKALAGMSAAPSAPPTQ